ncbi:MAG: hypothetical protein WC658_05495, partial [Candidatus Omnitrophota bacterium]
LEQARLRIDEKLRQESERITHRVILEEDPQTYGLADRGTVGAEDFATVACIGSKEGEESFINHSLVILDGLYQRGPPVQDALVNLLSHEVKDLQHASHQDEPAAITAAINSELEIIFAAQKKFVFTQKFAEKAEEINNFARGLASLSAQEIDNFLLSLLTDRQLSAEFSTHLAVDFLRLAILGEGLGDSAIRNFTQVASTAIPEVARRIIDEDLNVPVASLFELLIIEEIRQPALVNFIEEMEDYTNQLTPRDEWVFDKSSRTMRFISAALDELVKAKEQQVDIYDQGVFLVAARRRFEREDLKLKAMIEQVLQLKQAKPVDLVKLAKAYEAIVPRLINLKVIHFYEAKYGKPQAQAMQRDWVQVTFPVGISYSRCAWDNFGRVPRSAKELVRYFLAGINFLIGENKQEARAGYVEIQRLAEPKLVLHARSYDEEGKLARLEMDLAQINSQEFFDYRDLRYRLIKEALVASGVVQENSQNIGADILSFTQGTGMQIEVYSIIPGGTGLGTSGAVATALLTALDRLQGKNTPIDPDLGDRSAYLEHLLGLGSGMQDWRRPVAGPNAFKIYYQPGMSGFPTAQAEFLTTIDAQAAAQHLILFFPGFKRQATGRLNTVLSGHLARDRSAYQAMRDVILLQDKIEAAFRENDYATVGRLSKQYQGYRDIMDPTTDAHILKAIAAIKAAPGIWGAAFTGSPGGVMMIWCASEVRQRTIEYLNGLKDNVDLVHEDKPIFAQAQVLDTVFTTEGYQVHLDRSINTSRKVSKDIDDNTCPRENPEIFGEQEACCREAKDKLDPEDTEALDNGEMTDIFSFADGQSNTPLAEQFKTWNELYKQQGAAPVINVILLNPEFKQRVSAIIRSHDRLEDAGGFNVEQRWAGSFREEVL